MKKQPEILIGQIAVEAGLLTPAQLAECLQEQETTPGAPPLGAIFLRRGLLRESDVQALLEEQQRRLSEALDLSDPRVEDAVLGRLLIRQGLATESQVFECLRLQASGGGRLGEILVRKNYIASDAMDTAILLRKKEVFVCPSCSAQYSTLGADPGRKYPCRKCGCVMEREERVFRPGETTGALRVDIPEDAAAHAKDPERRFAGGRYLLIEEVGRGGMGVVWKAWQTDLRRYVAIKMLAGGGWSDHDLRRFHREAQMAAGLSHSNIASIYEVGADAGRHYIAMEFVDGEPLSAIVVPPSHGPRHGTQRRTVGLRRAVEIVRDAAIAVDYAHSKGLIHRDLKPGNIMVARQGGRTYVMDFGLARPVREDTASISESIVGTPAYMAPEQARGAPIDRRADVYSLGAVLYAVLTGRPPYAGRTAAETLLGMFADDPPPPRRLNPRVHADLETICLKAMDRDRHRRYDSAKTLADDLARYLEGEPIGARPLTWRERLWKEARRRPAASVLVAAALAGAVLLALTILAIDLRTSRRIDAFLREGDAQLERQNYEGARTSYEKALALDPGHEGAQRRVQFCARALDERRKGVAAQVAALREVADALFDARAWEKALAQYRRILGIDPANEWAQERRRLCDAELEKSRAKSREREDAAAQVRTLLERERQRVERRERALQHYEAARGILDAAGRLKGRPDAPIPEVLFRYREASEALGRALREDDTYVEALFLRGLVRFRLAEYAHAEQDFAAAHRGGVSFAAPAFQLAVLQEVRYQVHSRSPYVKNPEEVKAAVAAQLKAIDAVLAMTASAGERWGAKALAHLRARRFDDALEALDKVRAEGAGQFALVLLRAIIHLEAGNDAQALPGMIAALELEPASFELHYLRALLRDRQDELDNALEDANRAVEIAPALHLGYLLRAHVHHRRGDLRRARADLEKAAKLPGAPEPRIREVLESMREDSDR